MNLQRLSQLSLVFIAVCLIVVILATFASFLRPFVFAIIITIIAVPYTLKEKDKKSHWSVTTLKWILIVFFILFIISVASIFLKDDVSNLEEGEVHKSFSEQILEFEADVFGKKIQISSFLDEEKLNEISSKSFSLVFDTIRSFFSEIVTIGMFLIFLIPSYKVFIDSAKAKMKKKQANNFLKSIHSIEMSLRDYLLIKTQVSFLTGLVTGITLYLFGVEYAFLFGFLTFILNYIPNIGSFFAVAVVLIYDVLFGDLTLIFWIILAIILTSIQFIIGSVIEPKLAGDKLSMSPIVILLSLFFWGYIWGLWGMFFSVPLTLFVKAILDGFGVFESFKYQIN